MGIRNKERRRAKQRRQRGRGDSQRTGQSHWRTGAATATAWRADDRASAEYSAEYIDALIMGAAHAKCEGQDAHPVLAELAGATAGPCFRELVASRVYAALTNHASPCLAKGWEPVDVANVLRRLAGATAAGLVEGALPEAVQRQRVSTATEQRWKRQLEDLAGHARVLRAASPTWEPDLTAAVAALGALGHLPALPDLGPCRPTETVWPGTGGEILAKVRSLLAKAEATEFEEEAGAFLAKAQELMARHNLDRASVEAGRDDASQPVEGRRCWLDDPYLKQKAYLVHVVAKANRCRTVADYQLGMATLFGAPDDLATVEMLFTSLLVHATRQMTLRATGSKPSLGPSARRPAFRRSFLFAYADRIGARLCEASDAATKAAVQDRGDRLLPVLVSRGRLVDEAVHKAFPKVVSTEFSVTDYDGWVAGRAAADLADLAMQPKLAASTYC